MTAEPNQMYGPHVAGPEGFTVVEYFSRLRAAYEVTFDTDSGPRQLDLLAKSNRRGQRCSAAVSTNEGA